MADELVETMRQSAEFLRTVKAVTGEDDAQFSLASVRLQRASAEIARLQAEVEALKPWRDAVEDALITSWLGTADTFPDPCTALDKLIEWSMSVAVDTAVSRPAADLVAEARGKAVADVAAWLRAKRIYHLNLIASVLETDEFIQNLETDRNNEY